MGCTSLLKLGGGEGQVVVSNGGQAGGAPPLPGEPVEQAAAVADSKASAHVAIVRATPRDPSPERGSRSPAWARIRRGLVRSRGVGLMARRRRRRRGRAATRERSRSTPR